MGWDESKAITNLHKHKVSFEEAQTVFYDPIAYIFDDERHSKDEFREIIIGHSNTNRLWVFWILPDKPLSDPKSS